MKEIDEALKTVDFSKMSKIKEKLLSDMHEQRKLNHLNQSRDLDLDELDQVVAAKGEDWKLKNK